MELSSVAELGSSDKKTFGLPRVEILTPKRFGVRINVEQLGNGAAVFRIHQSAESQAADWLISIIVNI